MPQVIEGEREINDISANSVRNSIRVTNRSFARKIHRSRSEPHDEAAVQ
jgi:hypothetical protein